MAQSWRMLVWFAVFASLLGPAFAATKINRLDRAWKRYRNQQFGYCISYPSRWVKGEASDGAGIWMEAGRKKHWPPLGEMDVQIIAGSDTRLRTAPATLVENLTAHLEGLKRFERAQGMQVIERRAMALLGSPALLLKDRYHDPLDGSAWVDEAIFASRNATVYRLELECRADQLARFEPVFERFSGSFQFVCERSR